MNDMKRKEEVNELHVRVGKKEGGKEVVLIVSLAVLEITLAENYCFLSGCLSHVHPSCFGWLKHFEQNVHHVLLMNFQFLHGGIL